MPWTTLCDLDDVPEGEAKPIDIDGYRLAVFKAGGRAYVLDDKCPHAGAPMSAGWVADGCAVCPRHLWRFDLSTGKLAGGADGLRAYTSRVVNHNGRTLVQAELAMP